MRIMAALGIVCLLAVAVSAHPGNGIAVAPDGTVYFADVGRETIWKLGPERELTPLVRNRWTHSLFLRKDGTLFYEREEPVEGVAPCSFWRITPEGVHERLIPPQHDRRNFSGAEFVVDDDGNVYYAHNVRDQDNKWRTRIMCRTPGGEVRPFTGMGDGPLFRDGGPNTSTIRIVTAMAMGPDGAIYFADRDHIRRVVLDGEEAGTVTTIAVGLIDDRPREPPQRRGPPTTINRLYGMCVEASGDVLVAYQAGRRVMRVSSDGHVENVYQTRGRWSPLGVAAMDGTVYVLEVGDRSIEDLRVVTFSEDGSVSTLVTVE